MSARLSSRAIVAVALFLALLAPAAACLPASTARSQHGCCASMPPPANLRHETRSCCSTPMLPPSAIVVTVHHQIAPVTDIVEPCSATVNGGGLIAVPRMDSAPPGMSAFPSVLRI
jgi:hypothetical protein